MTRRYAAELVGTFGIVFPPVAYSATSALPGAQPGLLGSALISGLAVLVMIYTFGPISAAHFNPAVTLGFALSRKFPWKHVIPYWLSQVAGGVLAAGLVALFYGPGHGVHIPSDPNLVFRNLGTEVCISFLLMIVIMAVATDKRISGTVPALAIGTVVVVGVMIAGPVTGGSMNPARSLGPALFGSGKAISNLWIYLLGPVLGVSLAAVVYESIRLEPDHAKGAPAEL